MARYLERDADFELDADFGDENLPLPRELDSPWVQRSRRPVGVLIVLLVAGVVTLRVTGDDTAPRPVASPSADPDRVRDVSHPLQQAVSGLVSDDLIDACPAAASCRTSTVLPAAVAAALRDTYPEYTTPSVRTVTVDDAGGPRLLGRFVHAVTTDADVTVQVMPRALPPSTVLTGSGGASIVVVQQGVGTSTVRVTVGGPAATRQPGSAPVRLAGDARLLQP